MWSSARPRSTTPIFPTSRRASLSCRRATRPNTAGFSVPDVTARRAHVMTESSPLRVGIGGPVGSGKTALTLALCKALRDKYDIAAVTNDIYTEEDAQFLVRNEALVPERIIGVEAGGCPHTAIREDASINLEAVARLNRRFPPPAVTFTESAADNPPAP